MASHRGCVNLTIGLLLLKGRLFWESCFDLVSTLEKVNPRMWGSGIRILGMRIRGCSGCGFQVISHPAHPRNLDADQAL